MLLLLCVSPRTFQTGRWTWPVRTRRHPTGPCHLAPGWSNDGHQKANTTWWCLHLTISSSALPVSNRVTISETSYDEGDSLWRMVWWGNELKCHLRIVTNCHRLLRPPCWSPHSQMLASNKLLTRCRPANTFPPVSESHLCIVNPTANETLRRRPRRAVSSSSLLSAISSPIRTTECSRCASLSPASWFRCSAPILCVLHRVVLQLQPQHDASQCESKCD